MIDISVRIKNPVDLEDGRQKDFVVYEPRISKNKAFAFQISWSKPWHLFVFELNTHLTGSDHAGPRLFIDVLGLFMNIQIYDIRHWDYDNDKWEEYPEKE